MFCNGHTTSGATYVYPNPSANQTSSDHSPQSIIHTGSNWNPANEPQLFSGAWEKRADARPRKHLWWHGANVNTGPKKRISIGWR